MIEPGADPPPPHAPGSRTARDVQGPEAVPQGLPAVSTRKPPNAVVLWEHFLVLAVVFGIADKVIENGRSRSTR
jgi:hypothetical protein